MININVYYHYYICIQAIKTVGSPELSRLKQLAIDVSESKKLCQTLLDRQAEFEDRITSHLDTVQRYLQDLIVLAPPPFSPLATAATPVPAVLPEKQIIEIDDGFTYMRCMYR